MDSTFKVESIYRRKIEKHQIYFANDLYATINFDHMHDNEGSKNGNKNQHQCHSKTSKIAAE